MKKRYWMLLGVLSLTAPVLAQDEEKKGDDLYELSLEELMNVQINSASKKNESLFDAPLSSYTITRADIDKAGSTSIMEALRLAPGVIVREQTNGVYDIHIRGFDNVQRTSETFTKSNLATLVMIDNRPVFNHNLGGTFWEALPVDLNDVERIEVVRGPSAPLFGPNAVTGVINIITKRASSKVNATANVQAGTPSTTIANAAFGMKTSEKFNFTVSGNYQKRQRFDENYYRNATGKYEIADSIIKNNSSRYFPDPSLAMERHGVNAFMNYKPTEHVSFDVSLGEQKATTQKIFLAGATYFTTNETKSQYANLSTKIYGLNVRASVNGGTDNLNKGGTPSQYDFTVGDVTAEYTFALGENVSIVPGVSYQSVKFNDEDYVNDGPTFLGGQDATINTSAGFLRIDARPINIWRIIAAVRADKFSSPDDVYLAYEFANTLKLNDKNLIRVAVTRSNSGSFIGLNYLALSVPVAPGINFERIGNQNLKLLTVNMVEVGFRSQLSKSLQLDIDIFRQQAENFTTLATTSPISQQFQDTDISIVQNGLTLSLNFVPNDKIQVKPFVTVQKSETSDLPTADAYEKEHKNTPSFYGGYFFNYKPVSKLNINLNGYYFAAHRQYDSEDPAATGTNGDIKGKFLVNAKVNYAINSHVSFFVNGRNVVASDSREFYGADQIGGLYMAGATFSFN